MAFAITFVDAFTRFTRIYFLKTKYASFIHFKTQAKLQFNRKILIFQSNWGGEHHSLATLFDQKGILFKNTCPHTSEQNGIVERTHWHIVETGLILLAQSGMPFTYWIEAFATAVHLINRLPTPILNHKSPFEALYHTKPNYDFLKVFGCLCYPYLRPYNFHKLQFRSSRYTFLGYSLNIKVTNAWAHLGKYTCHFWWISIPI